METLPQSVAIPLNRRRSARSERPRNARRPRTRSCWMGQTMLNESLRAVEAEIAAGRPERALELCQQLATRYPRALAVQRVLGEIYLALRKPREALGALDRAPAGNPEDARARASPA